jgi:hypothetical protein
MFQDELAANGFVPIPAVVSADACQSLLGSLAVVDSDQPGTRCLLSYDWCQSLVSRLRRHTGLAAVIPENYVAVQCTYFEKSVSRNWLVPIHQDLSIPVEARISHPNLQGWSEKEGTLFVQPSAGVLEQLLAVRIHLDPCSAIDGPLQFVPGTHLSGRFTAETASRIRQTSEFVTCTMERGDALAMRPLTLHASSKATGTSKRRVLHILFGPPELPFGLQWPGGASLASVERQDVE